MADLVTALQKQVERKKAEIAAAERALMDARSYLQGLEDALKTVGKNSSGTPSPVEKTPRAGSDIAKCMDSIKLHGSAMHIDALLNALGKEQTKANRLSLAGSLAGYVREGKWFTRPLPNTFGLIGMNSDVVEEGGEEKPPAVM
jgi:hypothetical protein